MLFIFDCSISVTLWLSSSPNIVVYTSCNALFFWLSFFIRSVCGVTWVCSICVTSCLFYSFIITIFHLFLLIFFGIIYLAVSLFAVMKCWYMLFMVSVRSICNMENLLWSCIEYLCCKSSFDLTRSSHKFFSLLLLLRFVNSI